MESLGRRLVAALAAIFISWEERSLTSFWMTGLGRLI